jgi:hypothetical protein
MATALRRARRRPLLALLGTLLLVCGLAGRCLALVSIMPVSKEKAKEMGINVTLQPREEDVWVRVDFKTTGPLKGYRYANLDLKQGKKRLLMAALMSHRPRTDSPDDASQVDFYLDPAALPDASVTLIAYEGRGGIGYELQMKDFIAKAAAR